MVKRVFGVLAVLGITLVAANMGCGDSGTDGQTVDCTTVKGFSELSGAFSKCTNCHDSALKDLSTRQNATLGHDYDTYENAKKFPANITEQVEDDEMPSPGSPALTATEKTDMLTWAACDTPP